MTQPTFPDQPNQNENRPFTAPNSNAELTDDRDLGMPRESLSLGGKLAWVLVAAVALAMISTTALFRSSEESRTVATESDLFPIQLQARTIVGQKGWSGGSESGAAVPESLNDGTYEQRLCFVILINESIGAEEAARKLEQLDDAAEEAEFEASEDQIRLRGIIGKLVESYGSDDYVASEVSDDDRQFVKDRLGWIGQLGLVPEGTADSETRSDLLGDATQSMGVMFGFIVLVGLTLMSGFVIAVVLIVLFATRKLQTEFKTHGKSVNIYIETFAIWLLLFFVGPTVTAIAIQACGIEITEGLNMGISIGFFFGSLVVLAYPVVRGLKFSQVMSDIGWKAKWGGVADFFISPFSYVAGTPLMFVGLMCVLVLTLFAGLFAGPKEFGTSVAAGHPIQETIASGSWINIGYVVLMACIAAPLVEETMFRGVLYRHLRELSGSWATWGSVIFASIFNGLIFAAIHPQGFVAIPLLTALAINFSLAREWRDSLVAPIIMHSINNSMVTILMLVMMS